MFHPSDHDVELSEEEFRLLRDFIHEQFGLFFDDSQRGSLRSRLSGRLASLDLVSFEDYYHYLRFGPQHVEERDRMVTHLTNNETYFYREMPQLQVFADDVLKALKERKAPLERPRAPRAVRGLLDRGRGAHAGHDPLRQRPVLLELGRAGHGPRRGRTPRWRRRAAPSITPTPSGRSGRPSSSSTSWRSREARG